ncbi:MAG: cbb3-type cytochrome c oxidase subunit I [Planctomycetes bacterium]|nr:cbb3-type cytochrome c oxidase subunit I [Planctomycetota bacterium]MCB9825058.1 cbb3-type cytochrome c oxidase subunit I [Planctomycetota bacterium]MCB9830068.1 cbb3-type cytochrome c oxidase subunit I [Planctomycetota bacterium]MCB9902052.1 cbb3-type cytochrome c oxidase subunit I [Planctomycetota bacterium]
MGAVRWIDQRKHWWKVFVVICAVSFAVVGYIGYKTYEYAPPIANFTTPDGSIVVHAHEVTKGQLVFFRYGLMDYGSFLGDGGMRGPDFTAEALQLVTGWMNEEYDAQWKLRIPEDSQRRAFVRSQVQAELRENGYDSTTAAVMISPARATAFDKLVAYYGQKFGAGGALAGQEVFHPAGYITDADEIRQLSAFFFWGSWMCAAQRPGFDYSYTHNWPYDPEAGNTPTPGIVFWSVIGALVLILSMGVVFYFYGKLDRETVWEGQAASAPPLATIELVDASRPTPSQRATYKYFAVAAVLFVVQVFAGLAAISDFTGFFRSIGVPLDELLPVTVSRAWHSQVSVLWIAVCWFGASIWVLPVISRPEPHRQLGWINALFWMLVVVAAGTLVGIPLGVHGLLGEAWRWLGLQGWEYVQLGRAFQFLLYAAFIVWLIVVVRGLWPVLRQRATWSLPNWMVYSICGIIFMFTAGFVAGPETNFVIADFWRWCTIHMWVEAFFELFTTILVAYFMYLMGFVNHAVASRVVYLAAILFLGSGLIGISHNFYWNAKSIETLALGGVLSTLQIVPLVLLTVEAWRFRHMPQSTLARLKKKHGHTASFGLPEAFLFLVGVNFWNFLGAGVLGFAINLPIVNYYQHGTYLTANHGHAALFGVYGNLAIAAMLFCGRWLVEPARWNARLLRTSFWSLNVGLLLMVVLDLFPVGVDQLLASMTHGYAYARSEAYIGGATFQTYTWLRAVGVTIFVVGGMLPVAWFVVTRGRALKAARPPGDAHSVPVTVLGHIGTPRGGR